MSGSPELTQAPDKPNWLQQQVVKHAPELLFTGLGTISASPEHVQHIFPAIVAAPLIRIGMERIAGEAPEMHTYPFVYERLSSELEISETQVYGLHQDWLRSVGTGRRMVMSYLDMMVGSPEPSYWALH